MSNTKPAAIDTLSPLRRIERRLIGNVVGAQNSIKYWQDEVVRLEALVSLIPSNDAYDRQDRINKLGVKVLRLQADLDQATEELNVFRNLAGQ